MIGSRRTTVDGRRRFTEEAKKLKNLGGDGCLQACRAVRWERNDMGGQVGNKEKRFLLEWRIEEKRRESVVGVVDGP